MICPAPNEPVIRAVTRAGSEFDERAIHAGLVAVGYEGEFTDDGKLIAAGNFLAGGEKFRAGRHHEVGALVGKHLEVGEFDGARRADEEGLGQIQLERNLVLGGGEGGRQSQSESESEEGSDEFHWESESENEGRRFQTRG